MHEKVSRRIVDEAVPLLAQVVSEGIEQGIFACDHVEERVRMILILSDRLFDGNGSTAGVVEFFIDTVEKSLGAQSGTLGFIHELIR